MKFFNRNFFTNEIMKLILKRTADNLDKFSVAGFVFSLFQETGKFWMCVVAGIALLFAYFFAILEKRI